MGKLHGNSPNGRGNTILASTNNVIDDKLTISAENESELPTISAENELTISAENLLTISAENELPIPTTPIQPERDNQLFNAISLIAGTTVGAGKFYCKPLK
jgi:hypothetical protein